MRHRTSAKWALVACAAFLGSACAGTHEDTAARTDTAAQGTWFASPAEAVREAGRLLRASDWPALARCYDLSLTPHVTQDDLTSGRFFAQDQTAGGAAAPRGRPFPRESEFVEARAVGDEGSLPCVWVVTTRRSFDAGGGMTQRVTHDCHMLQTAAGFRFLPPAAIGEPRTNEAAAPADAPSPTAWGARGADPALFLRPALADRVRRELPAAGARNLADLAAALERLKPLAAANPGRTRPGDGAAEPPTVYEPSDDEILACIAGDRMWRTTQIAPPETIEAARKAHPELPSAIDYPHLEVREIAGASPRYVASGLVWRHLPLDTGVR